MRKIPTLFRRDPDDRRRVLPEVTPGCEWVLAGEGTATRKYDGTCVLFDGDRWYARREVKPGKPAPDGFRPVETDETTGKTVGWEPVEQSSHARWHAEAVRNAAGATDDAGRLRAFPAGTYELIGPKVNGNPERQDEHRLLPHADAEEVRPFSRTFEGLRDAVLLLADDLGAEGLVFQHPDGRMAKLKARDFPPPVVAPAQPEETP